MLEPAFKPSSKPSNNPEASVWSYHRSQAGTNFWTTFETNDESWSFGLIALLKSIDLTWNQLSNHLQSQRWILKFRFDRIVKKSIDLCWNQLSIRHRNQRWILKFRFDCIVENRLTCAETNFRTVIEANKESWSFGWSYLLKSIDLIARWKLSTLKPTFEPSSKPTNNPECSVWSYRWNQLAWSPDESYPR